MTRRTAHLARRQRRHLSQLLSVAASLLVVVSCSPDRDPAELFGSSEAGVLVIDALLLVDESLPEIYLGQTLPPGAVYDRRDAAITDAEVVLRRGSAVFEYSADPGVTGRYNPPGETPTVLPETTYDLEVLWAEQLLTAQTTTPARVHIRNALLVDEGTGQTRRRLVRFDEGDVYNALANQLHYQDGVVELVFDRTEGAVYQLAVFSLDPESDFVLEADFLEEDDFAEFERSGSSPPLDVAADRARLPWFAVVFGGRHLVKLYALDENWFDYVRSAPDRDGGFAGSLAGDNFERPLFNVAGGVGLFGSAAVDSVGFFVLPRLR